MMQMIGRAWGGASSAERDGVLVSVGREAANEEA